MSQLVHFLQNRRLSGSAAVAVAYPQPAVNSATVLSASLIASIAFFVVLLAPSPDLNRILAVQGLNQASAGSASGTSASATFKGTPSGPSTVAATSAVVVSKRQFGIQGVLTYTLWVTVTNQGLYTSTLIVTNTSGLHGFSDARVRVNNMPPGNMTGTAPDGSDMSGAGNCFSDAVSTTCYFPDFANGEVARYLFTGISLQDPVVTEVDLGVNDAAGPMVVESFSNSVSWPSEGDVGIIHPLFPMTRTADVLFTYSLTLTNTNSVTATIGLYGQYTNTFDTEIVSMVLTGNPCDLSPGVNDVSFTCSGQIPANGTTEFATEMVHLPGSVGLNAELQVFSGDNSDFSNDSFFDVWTVVEFTDLTVSKSSPFEIAEPFQPITYTVIVTNTGPSILRGGWLTETYPLQTELVQLQLTGGSSNTIAGGLEWDMPLVPPGSSEVLTVTLQYTATISAPVVITNSVELTTTTGIDLFLENNFSDVPIEITPPIFELVPIHGRKFVDFNEDQLDFEEPGLDGVVIELLNASSVVIATTTTMSMDSNLDEYIDPFSETGMFWFDPVPPGQYSVREILPDGMTGVYPVGEVHLIDIPPFVQEIPPVLFGNFGQFDWGDLPDPRANAVNPCPALNQCYPTFFRNGGAGHLIIPRPFVLGILIDAEPDGQPSTFATGDDVNGAADEDGLINVAVNPDGSLKLDVFMTDPQGQIRFLDVWIDLNDDGFLDPAVENVIVAAPLAPNALTSVPTGQLGYSVGDLIGYMRLRLSSVGTLPPTGIWIDGEVEDYVDYGIDFGDLPDPRVGATSPCPGGANQCYPTKAPTGPSHRFMRGAFVLGDRIDGEPDGQPSVLASGDDDAAGTRSIDYSPAVPPVQLSDEDGLISVSVQPDGSITLQVMMTDPNNQQRFLDVWIDLNDDGFLADAPPPAGLLAEDVVVAAALAPNAVTTINTGVLNPPLQPNESIGFMRLRLSSTGGLPPTGPADDGEVEDYYDVALDFGDAPEEMDQDHPDFPFGYPTKRANNGAFHAAAQANRIGADIDGEVDGQPTTFADGDDGTQLDDEDGVLFGTGFTTLLLKLTPGSSIETAVPGLMPGSTGEVYFLPSRNGKIDAWMDWNGDGDWDDTGENIFSNETVSPPRDTLDLAVPANAVLGFTFARFRFSINGTNNYTGFASDGEVEDYLVSIVETTSIERNPEAEIPSEYELFQNYPNPFNPVTNIRFAITSREWVTIEVYNILGRRVTTLVDGYIEAGEFTVAFEASELPSGIYIYRMTAGSFSMSKQLTLLK